MQNKNWYESWTVWFNLALLAVSVIQQLSQIIPLPPQVLLDVAFVGNLLLRFKTTTGISLSETLQ